MVLLAKPGLFTEAGTVAPNCWGHVDVGELAAGSAR